MAIEDSTAGLIAQIRNFLMIVATSPADFGLTNTLVTMLTAAVDLLETKQTELNTLEVQVDVVRPDKNAAYKTARKLFAQMRETIRESPLATEAQRESLGLTPSASDAVGDPFEFAPLLAVVQAGTHEHKIQFFMPGEPSTSKKKPRKDLRCSLFVKIDGAATTNLKDYQKLIDDGQSPYNFAHEAEDTGKMAHYIGRWYDENTEETSPLSEVFSIVIS